MKPMLTAEETDAFGKKEAARRLGMSVRSLDSWLGKIPATDEEGEYRYWRTGPRGDYCFDAGSIQRIKKAIAWLLSTHQEPVRTTRRTSSADTSTGGNTKSRQTRRTRELLGRSGDGSKKTPKPTAENVVPLKQRPTHLEA